ncbi:MAG: DNA repair protein RecN, partial [Chloroflexota bacterium]|nr:DNA repair protein RecN [Chloroflexota bacterium]
HFRIIKRDVRGRTISDVERLDEPERIEELAAMLDGAPITPVARASARDLAERAAARKTTTATTRQPAAD